MKVLHIDIETYCELDLKKTGVHAYAEHPSFEILLFAYAYDDDDPVQVVDMTKEEIPADILLDLLDEGIKKVAHNATFEMVCLSRYLEVEMLPNQWICTMSLAAHYGLPLSLDAVSSVLKLQSQKLAVGHQLIRYFSMPCKPTKTNGGRTRNLPEHDLEKWILFKEYCKRDVEAEQEIYNSLCSMLQPDFERDTYILDQKINKTGIKVDYTLVASALAIGEGITNEALEQLKEMTGLSNPNSTAQFKQYLAKKGINAPSFTKNIAKEMYKTTTNMAVKKAIGLKLLLSNASVKKYDAMVRARCLDERIHGAFQYYGAMRTGRWAGRLVQLQNLKQNHLDDLDLVRQIVRDRDIDSLELLYEDIPNVLGQLVRTAFVPKENHKFIVADFSAIEARVIAWLANERWRLDVFSTHGKIYEASASQMFKVPIEEITKGSDLRQKGKVSELALGYGGSVGALKAMGALDMGLNEDELKPLVYKWRGANPAITKFWRDCESAAKRALETRRIISIQYGIKFAYQKGCLIIVLPSGRKLVYQQARITEGTYGLSIAYMSMNQTSRKWMLTLTHGGKLVENIVQAVARDCLAIAMLRLDKNGHRIVAHVHDEVIIEAPLHQTVEEVCEVMGEPIVWAKGLYLKADGYEGNYYFKD